MARPVILALSAPLFTIGLLATAAEAKIIGQATCAFTEANGRITLGAQPRAKLHATGQELLFDFFDVTFGAGQPVSYNGGNWVDNFKSHTVYANLNFSVLIPEEAQDDATFEAHGQWDDLGHMPGDWESSPVSASFAMRCQLRK